MNRNIKSDDIEDMFEDKDYTICQNNPRSHPEASDSMESDDHAKTSGHDPGSQTHLTSFMDVGDQYFQPSIHSLPWSIPLDHPQGAQ